MSENYSFSEENWNETRETTLDYADANSTLGTTLNDSIGYVTAIEDPDNPNETQYLSILEAPNDITLEDIQNLSLNSTIEPQEDLVFTESAEQNNENEPAAESENLMNMVDIDGQQVVVFSVDGSDDLYGIQMTEDEMGNMQKYQFKFRTNEEGQLEVIPESIALLVNEDEMQGEQQILDNTIISDEVHEASSVEKSDSQDNAVPDPQATEVYNGLESVNEEEECVQVYVKGEQHSPLPNIEEECSEGEHADELFEENVDYQNLEDVKAGILQSNTPKPTSPEKIPEIKSEIYQEESQNFAERNEDPFASENLQNEQASEEEQENNSNETQNSILEYRHFSEIGDYLEAECREEQIETEEITNRDHYEQIYIQENLVTENETNINQDSQDYMSEGGETEQDKDDDSLNGNETDNESENEAYQIVEGMHVTGDIDGDSNSNENEPILRELLKKRGVDTGITIKNPSPGIKKIKEVRNKNVLYYVIYPEKENVNSIRGDYVAALPQKLIKAPNPRSVLKSSFSTVDAHATEPNKTLKSVTKPIASDERYNKRFAKSKEAMQAKQFHNFISTTTIPHAPVRQTRLPRKQAIKPVMERRDEEIIVQEVMVSSNGFIEDIGNRLKNSDKLEVTAIVELTDSDDEYAPKKITPRKKKSSKSRRQSDLSEASVIEIIPSDEEEGFSWRETSILNTKKPFIEATKTKDEAQFHRRRGRPPKNKSDNQISLEESPKKKVKANLQDNIAEEKTEIKCPHCTKTFASQNSLTTHIHHHNLENSLKSLHNGNKRQSSIPKINKMLVQYNHKCEDCSQTFKNVILLNRHVCPNKKTGFQCSTCLKKFTDITLLNHHKKTHVKYNLIKNTSVVKVSPKKALRPSILPIIKSPKKMSYKCKDCPQICTSSVNLTIHSRIHKKFLCPTCPLSFSSKLLLDTHIRTSCVKPKSPINKRLSFKVRKSFLHTPPRVSTIKVGEKPLVNTSIAPSLNSTMQKLDCEVCNRSFYTHKGLFKHKVQAHGFHTPDKTLLEKPRKSLYKPIAAHSGIPANERMRKAFAALREKLEAKENVS